MELKLLLTKIENGFWINRKDLEIESDRYKWVQFFDKCDPEKQK